MSRRIFKDIRGISLVEVLVGVAILGILVSGTAAFFQHSFKQEARLTAKQESRSLYDELALYYINGANCGIMDISTLSEINVSSTTAIEVESGLIANDGRILKKGTDKRYGKLELIDNSPIMIGPLTNLTHLESLPGFVTSELNDAVGSYSRVGDSDSYMGEMRVGLKRLGSSAGAEFLLRFAIVLAVDPTTKKITGCHSIPEVKHAQEACESISGGGDLSADWNPDTFHCDITLNSNSESGNNGLCDPDDPCEPSSSKNLNRLSVILSN